jgi:hypothetical protein
MIFAIGVATSVCATIVCAICVTFFRQWRSRKGALAGWWWQVTYPPRRHDVIRSSSPATNDVHINGNTSEATGAISKDGDEAEVSSWALPDPATFPWSVEILLVKNHGRKFEAKGWRVYDSHFERTWLSEGLLGEDSIIDGTYKSDRGEGGHGTFQLWMISTVRYCGIFSESRKNVIDSSLKYEFVGAPLEWIRVGSELDHKVRSWFDSPNFSLHAIESCWPGKVRSKMRSIFDNPSQVPELPWFSKFGYTAGLINPMIPLELEKIIREREELKRQAREIEKQKWNTQKDPEEPPE